MPTLQTWTDELTTILGQLDEMLQRLRQMGNQRPQPSNDADASLALLNRLRALRRNSPAQRIVDEIGGKCSQLAGEFHAKFLASFADLEKAIATQLERGGRDENRPGVVVADLPSGALGTVSNGERIVYLGRLPQDHPLRTWIPQERCPVFGGSPCLVLGDARQPFRDRADVLQRSEESFASQMQSQREREAMAARDRERIANANREHAMNPAVLAEKVKQLEAQLASTGEGVQ